MQENFGGIARSKGDIIMKNIFRRRISKIYNVSKILDGCSLQAFSNVISSGGDVFAIVGRKKAALMHIDAFDALIRIAQNSCGSNGLGYLRYIDGEVIGPVSKFLATEVLKDLKKKCKVGNNDVIFLIADKKNGQIMTKFRKTIKSIQWEIKETK